MSEPQPKKQKKGGAQAAQKVPKESPKRSKRQAQQE